MNWKDIVKVEDDPSTRFRRYLQNEPKRGELTSKKKQPCDRCGAMVSARNTNTSKRGEHIKFCNACKNREE